MSKAKHTPLPWKLWPAAKGDDGGSGRPMITDESGAAGVAQFIQRIREYDRLYPKEAAANAEFVVRACNAHYDLLAACKAMVRTGKAPADIDAAYDLMRAAIAKAEGRA